LHFEGLLVKGTFVSYHEYEIEYDPVMLQGRYYTQEWKGVHGNGTRMNRCDTGMIPECTGVKQNDTRMTRNLPDDSSYFWCILFHSVPMLSNAQCTRALMFHHVTDQCKGVSWMRTISNAGKPRLKSHSRTQYRTPILR